MCKKKKFKTDLLKDLFCQLTRVQSSESVEGSVDADQCDNGNKLKENFFKPILFLFSFTHY